MKAIQDFRYALRQFARCPGFTLIPVVTAIGPFVVFSQRRIEKHGRSRY
jgi:hypothetical protein